MFTHPSPTATAPTVHFTYPPSYLLKFPPSPEPQVLNQPTADHSFARPFRIDPEFYNNALDVTIPMSIAIIYATTVTILNRVNKQREHKPWAFSKSLPFYAFVLIHNVFLALYSGWTFLGMIRAIHQSWPGWEGEYGFAGVVDTLCKLHGPRGLGSAATYSHESRTWSVTDTTIQLLQGSPDPTDVGRIWNEGLAFYGWLFYVSKFYDLVDTFIILAKGKKSSLLQTFHHAGAIMCMWAGIRYMSPPIWMFVLINSGLHTYMYTYYTLSALTVRIPDLMKRALTALQITQFIFGGSYAIAHLFVAYSIPVSTPYLFIHNFSSAIPSAASSASSVLASATATAGFSSWLKKAALRAAGEEGLAANVRNRQGETFGIDAIHAARVEKAQEEIRYKLQYQTVNCLDTSGQVFAILLNALYLTPLTLLFIKFFIEKYITRVRAATPPPDRKQILIDSGKEAVDDVEQEIREAMADEQNRDETDIPANVKAKIGDATANLKKNAANLGSKASETAKNANDVIKDAVQGAKKQVRNWDEKAEGKGKETAKNAEDVIKDTVQGAKGQGRKWNEKAEGKVNEETKSEEVNTGNEETKNSKSQQRDEDENELDDQDQSWEAGEGEEIESNELEGSAMSYEVNPDEVLNEAEQKAEEELQPDGGS